MKPVFYNEPQPIDHPLMAIQIYRSSVLTWKKKNIFISKNKLNLIFHKESIESFQCCFMYYWWREEGEESPNIHAMFHFFFIVHNRCVPFDKQKGLRKWKIRIICFTWLLSDVCPECWHSSFISHKLVMAQ